jgi:predicted RecA/RadA family phage recombinase
MKNYVSEASKITIAVTHPATPAAGDPVRIGTFCGAAESAEDSGGTTVVVLTGVVKVRVKAVNDGGNSAVAVGDAIYYDDDDTPPLSKKATGNVIFGRALEAISSGGEETIKVLLER